MLRLRAVTMDSGDQTIMNVIRDYWQVLLMSVSLIVGWANLKFKVKENTDDIENLKQSQSRIESKIEAKLDGQATDIKNILIMLGDIKRGN